MSTELFGRLIGHVSSIDLTNSGNRWITRKSDADANFLTSASLEKIRLSKNLGAARMEFSGNVVFAFVGIPTEGHDTLEGLTPIEITPAYFQLAVDALNLRPVATESEIRDALEFESDRTPGYSGHSLEQISPLFPAVSCWLATSDDLYLNDVNRTLGSAICRLKVETPLEIPNHLIEEFDRCFINSDQNFPFHLLIQALVSSFWSTQFVEIYRAVEQLFPAHYASELKLSLNLPHEQALVEISRALHNTVGWRPQEDLSLRHLLSHVSKSSLSRVKACLGLNDDNEDFQSVANRVYKIRNSSVHYRSFGESISLSEENWSSLNQCMLVIADELYSKFGPLFFQKEQT